jgi:hypothetical protein
MQADSPCRRKKPTKKSWRGGALGVIVDEIADSLGSSRMAGIDECSNSAVWRNEEQNPKPTWGREVPHLGRIHLDPAGTGGFMRAISTVMPMALIGFVCLSVRKGVMKTHRPKAVEWVALILIICFSLFMSSQGIKGLVADILSHLPHETTCSYETGALSPVSSMSFPGRAREGGC